MSDRATSLGVLRDRVKFLLHMYQKKRIEWGEYSTKYSDDIALGRHFAYEIVSDNISQLLEDVENLIEIDDRAEIKQIMARRKKEGLNE
jgi:hypothetical protein